MNHARETKRIEFEELAARFLASGLDELSLQRFDEILNAYPEWEEEWDRLLRTALTLRSAGLQEGDLGEPESPVSVSESDQKKPNVLSFRRSLSVIAAGFVVFLFPFLWYYVSWNGPGEPKGTTPTSAVTSIRGLCYDETGPLRLSQESPVRIAAGPGSICSFQFIYEKEVRIELRGPARLEVIPSPASLTLGLESGAVFIDSKQKTPGGRLFLKSAGMQLEAKGTRFYVKTEDRKLLISVSEGVVDVLPVRSEGKSDPSDEPVLSLVAGEQWEGKRIGSALEGKKAKADLTKQEEETTSSTSGESETILLQTLRTRSGETFTGTITQNGSGYTVNTASGPVTVPSANVERIDIRFADAESETKEMP